MFVVVVFVPEPGCVPEQGVEFVGELCAVHGNRGDFGRKTGCAPWYSHNPAMTIDSSSCNPSLKNILDGLAHAKQVFFRSSNT